VCPFHHVCLRSNTAPMRYRSHDHPHAPRQGDLVTWCWRMSHLIVVALFAMRARWLVGLITRSAGRKATPAPSWALSLLRAFFVWIYVALGVIFVLTVISGIVNWVIGEIKLQRECNQPLHFRAEPRDRNGTAQPERVG
jgi:lipid-A-disaccharide synthase-like uncharacterized protein